MPETFNYTSVMVEVSEKEKYIIPIPAYQTWTEGGDNAAD